MAEKKTAKTAKTAEKDALTKEALQSKLKRTNESTLSTGCGSIAKNTCFA